MTLPVPLFCCDPLNPKIAPTEAELIRWEPQYKKLEQRADRIDHLGPISLLLGISPFVFFDTWLVDSHLIPATDSLLAVITATSVLGAMTIFHCASFLYKKEQLYRQYSSSGLEEASEESRIELAQLVPHSEVLQSYCAAIAQQRHRKLRRFEVEALTQYYQQEEQERYHLLKQQALEQADQRLYGSN